MINHKCPPTSLGASLPPNLTGVGGGAGGRQTQPNCPQTSIGGSPQESLSLYDSLTHPITLSLARILTNSLTHSLTQEAEGQQNLTVRNHPAAEVPQSLSLSHSLT